MVPSHRGERYIIGCLDSLARQTLPPAAFELIVVLNGPPDGTAELLRAFTRDHPSLQLRVITLAEAGAGLARNVGISAARGEYLTFVDDDDWVSPGYLSGLLEITESHGPDVVAVATVADVTGDGVPTFTNYLNERLLPHRGTTLSGADAPAALGFMVAKLIRTSLLRHVRFETSLGSGEDLVFWYDVFSGAPFRVQICDPSTDVTYYRRVREDSISRRQPSFAFAVGERLDTIQLLAARPASTPAVERLRRHLIAAQTGHIHRFLTQAPDLHLQVVEEIRSRELDGVVPYDVLNRGVARDLAILYAFLPSADTSALVAARRIHKRQVLVDVISNNMWSLRDVDPSGFRIAHEFLGRHQILRNAVSAFDWALIQDFVDDGLEIIEGWEAAQGPYRSVYSRTMWPASHFLAAVHKLRHPEVHWIAEFSDPQLWNSNGERRKDPAERGPLLKELREGLGRVGVELPDSVTAPTLVEIVAYGLADEIVFTNVNQRDFMLGYLQDDALRARVLERSSISHHPTLPRSFYTLEPTPVSTEPRLLNIAYFGAFYATRGLTEVVEALHALSPDERSRLRLHVFTARPEDLKEQLAGTALAEVVEVNPYLSYLEFLATTTVMDVLLINDARTRHLYDVNPYLPSKWSDYEGSGRDIWRLVEPGSVLSTLTSRYTSTIGDVEGALRQLRAMLAEHVTQPAAQVSDPLGVHP